MHAALLQYLLLMETGLHLLTQMMETGPLHHRLIATALILPHPMMETGPRLLTPMTKTGPRLLTPMMETGPRRYRSFKPLIPFSINGWIIFNPNF